MIRHSFRLASTVLGLTVAGSLPVAAQSAPAPLDFSGVIFGNYQVRTDSAARAQAGGKNPNQFAIDRVYLTFRMPVGDRASIRATTDIVQNANGAFYNGWTVRLKYAYLQYALKQVPAGKNGFDALARIGMLHNVVIDHEETFWPRYISNVGVERFGFFSSSDLGLAAQVGLPSKMGEVYATVVNGPGYTAPENDRFKDVALRLSLTPLSGTSGWAKTLTFSPWFYRGATASRYVAGGTGQVGPVADGVARNRWGILAGVRDPRLTLGVQYARRTEGYEPANANTAAVPRTVSDSAGTLLSVHGVARPLSWTWGKNTAKLGIVARMDRYTPRTALEGTQRFIIAGLQLEPTSRTALTLDFQDQSPRGYPAGAPIAQTRIVQNRTWYLHWSATF